MKGVETGEPMELVFCLHRSAIRRYVDWYAPTGPRWASRCICAIFLVWSEAPCSGLNQSCVLRWV